MPSTDDPGVPAPGWYRDDSNPNQLRWWDGAAWTERTAAAVQEAWTPGRIALSPAAAWMGPVVTVGAALGLAVAATIAVAALIRQRPVAVSGFLLPHAIVMLAVGQLWMIAVISSRMPARPRTRRWSGPFSKDRRTSPAPKLRDFVGDLRPGVVVPLLGIAFAGWLLAMTAALSPRVMAEGGPDGSHPGCPHALNSHGRITCVTSAEYDRVGAGVQRFAAGIVTGFFAIHLCVAASGIKRKGP